MNKTSGRIDIMSVIAECDRLANSNQPLELGAHLRKWRSLAQDAGDRQAELSILSELVGHYRMQYDRERGSAAIEDALDLLRQLNIDFTASCGTILINIATALQSFGYFEEALKHYIHAGKCYAADLDKDNILWSSLYNNQASACCALGDRAGAERYYLMALEIIRKHHNLMDEAVTYINLAQLYDQIDEHDARIELMLDRAEACFNSPEAVRNGYYAHTALKCASAFDMFLREAFAAELRARAEDFYACS